MMLKGFLKKGFMIEPDAKPVNDEQICEEIVKYCTENNHSYEFESRKSPISFHLEGHLYSVKLKRVYGRFYNCWVLHCKEV